MIDKKIPSFRPKKIIMKPSEQQTQMTVMYGNTECIESIFEVSKFD
jgi:hypothetical protein